MRETLQVLDRRDLLRRQREELLQRLQGDLMCFWETETVRPLKPSVLDEVARTLYVAGTLWQVVPQLFRDLRTALSPELRRAIPSASAASSASAPGSAATATAIRSSRRKSRGRRSSCSAATPCGGTWKPAATWKSA